MSSDSRTSVFVEHPSKMNFVVRVVLIVVWTGTVFMAGIGWNSRINTNLTEMYDSIPCIEDVTSEKN